MKDALESRLERLTARIQRFDSAYTLESACAEYEEGSSAEHHRLLRESAALRSFLARHTEPNEGVTPGPLQNWENWEGVRVTRRLRKVRKEPGVLYCARGYHEAFEDLDVG